MAGVSGGMNTSKSNNASQSQGLFNQKVWNKQAPFLQDLYKQAGGLFNQINQGMQGAMPGAQAQVGAGTGQANQAVGQGLQGQQGQLAGGAYSDIDANKLQDQIYSSMQGPTATQEINNMIMGGKGNNYADAMKAQYVQDANVAQQNMLNNLDARASQSGLPGSSRQGIAAGIGAKDINQNLQRNMAQTGYETFDKDLQRKLAIAGQADQANLARQGMLSDMLAGKQGAMAGGLGQTGALAGAGGQNASLGGMGMDLYNKPIDAMNMFGNIIGRPTILGSGRNDALSTGSSSAFGMSGGAQAGSSVICTEFHTQGLMSDDLYLLDELFGEFIRSESPHIYDGYISWAPAVVAVMQKSPLLTRALWLLGEPWSREMAYELGVGEGSIVGKAIMKIGLAVCSFIGKLKASTPLEA